MNKVVVIGLGSMGRRRIRLMQTLDEVPQIVGVDTSADRQTQAHKEYGIETTSSLDEAIVRFGPNAALVCTSPASHGPIVMQCLEAGLNVYMEINLIGDWYDKASALAEQKGLKVFVSSTFLYHPQINYIINAVKGEKVNYIYHSGQYLPDWHPWESYKNFFVADKRTNACREILAIEFPWILKAFGEVESVHVMKEKDSSLELDFPDNFMISIRHKNGNKGIFCQDVISRKGMRGLEIYSENLHLFWDGRAQKLTRYNIGKKELETVVLPEDSVAYTAQVPNYFENVYREETKAFFDYLDGKTRPRHFLAEDKITLSLIDNIEKGQK